MKRLEMSLPETMTSKQQNHYKAFRDILFKHAHLGVKEFPDGSIAIGHVPHVAELAYFHRLFWPLAEPEIEALQDELEYDFPQSLKSFFLIHNGLGAFSEELNFYGQRRNWQRRDMEAAAQQPFSIQSSNIDRIPVTAAPNSLVIGSIGPDRSPITINKNGQAFIWPTQESPEPSKTYPDIFELIRAEAERLALTFDENGRPIDIKYH
jgi:SMI1 / KNR4 family (SUKH-1)